jgi:L-ascorbate metabolism protein UlaG (beta-lactamase superfamily)
MNVRVTYYGHACFGIEAKGKHILFDPFISPNELAKGKVNEAEVPADYILISHGHGDHVADAISIAKRTGALVVSNYEIVGWLNEKGIDNTHPLNIGGNLTLPFGKIKYVTAIHSSVLPDGTYGGVPGGFVIDFGDLCIYYAGDTALTLDMQLIDREFDIDHAFLPIGDNFTMGVDDAIVAAQFVQCKSVVGMHYDTFPPIVIDKVEAISKFEDAGAHLTLIEIGETIEL